ncbi:acyl-CoA dehydrogenase [Caulobacter flavus]|uniref:Acyl-CoA dehydrogenase n=1 Tax=Caulobacter flavus TaxID=1679497 RepID=A0A2N5CU65_9CAUL|nr:acyl-CoA dehydrogenase family protein [Caulobacter flavus]AYV49641.1 acyl-CoA dehydrogenase [Caulobacter flavus]PLR16319.1 acyl-CoA dehydrogenase [Caulobacter flavus]
MDLELSPEDLAFRDEVRAFLDAELTPALREAGRRMTSVFCDKDHSLAWQRILHAKGWVAPSWPVEHGGPGWSEIQRHVFQAECARAGAPSLAPMGLRMVAPAIMRFGTPAQKACYLPRILSGEDYWCQGYSEPGAGSDLASLRMKATPDGDDYVLNGSKIWTTHAHWATHMFCLVRTSTQGKPQAGITFLLVEMDRPGIRVDPIVTLAGEHEVNQVFFDDVRTPKADRLGEENQGWTVAKHLLEFERGGGYAAGLEAGLSRLREAGAAEDPDQRRRLAEAEIAALAIDVTERRVLSALAGGANPGPASSILKAQGSEALQRQDELAVAHLGAWAAVRQPAAHGAGSNEALVGPEHGRATMARYLNNRAASIYGGSNEIQRDIIAKLVLGL